MSNNIYQLFSHYFAVFEIFLLISVALTTQFMAILPFFLERWASTISGSERENSAQGAILSHLRARETQGVDFSSQPSKPFLPFVFICAFYL